MQRFDFVRLIFCSAVRALRVRTGYDVCPRDLFLVGHVLFCFRVAFRLFVVSRPFLNTLLGCGDELPGPRGEANQLSVAAWVWR